MSEFYVELVRNDGTVVKKVGPMTESRADQVELSVNINLDHEHYFTRITDEPE